MARRQCKEERGRKNEAQLMEEAHKRNETQEKLEYRVSELGLKRI